MAIKSSRNVDVHVPLYLPNCEDLDRCVTETVGTVKIVGTKSCQHNFVDWK